MFFVKPLSDVVCHRCQGFRTSCVERLYDFADAACVLRNLQLVRLLLIVFVLRAVLSDDNLNMDGPTRRSY